MNTKTQRHTGTFEARDEQGRVYTIEEYTDFIQTRVLSGPSQEVEGMKELRLSNGQHVNHVGRGEYEIVESGKKLKSKSPDAP